MAETTSNLEKKYAHERYINQHFLEGQKKIRHYLIDSFVCSFKKEGQKVSAETSYEFPYGFRRGREIQNKLFEFFIENGWEKSYRGDPGGGVTYVICSYASNNLVSVLQDCNDPVIENLEDFSIKQIYSEAYAKYVAEKAIQEKLNSCIAFTDKEFSDSERMKVYSRAGETSIQVIGDLPLRDLNHPDKVLFNKYSEYYKSQFKVHVIQYDNVLFIRYQSWNSVRDEELELARKNKMHMIKKCVACIVAVTGAVAWCLY